jgi:hyperosmotically inducible periplasmic protein
VVVIRTGAVVAAALLVLAGCVASVVGTGGGNQAGQEQGRAALQTDAALGAEVSARLAADKSLPAGAVSVDAHDGVVTLRGRVASSAQRAAAERDARATPGVKVVISELEVR